jgi:transcriptional regulator with XRE-family HTH domain
MDSKSFGKRLNQVRKDRGLTAEQLSEQCHVNAVYLRQIEGGSKFPSLPIFIDLCNALRISPNYLLQDMLVDNELCDLHQFTDLWKQASPSKQELCIALMRVVLENS